MSKLNSYWTLHVSVFVVAVDFLCLRVISYLFLHFDLLVLIILCYGIEEKVVMNSVQVEIVQDGNITIWKWLLWFIWELSLRGLCVERLIPCASLSRIRVLWKWLDLSGSALKRLVSSLDSWWLSGLLGNGWNFGDSRDSVEIGNWGHVLESLCFGFLSLYRLLFIFLFPLGEHFFFFCAPHTRDALPHLMPTGRNKITTERNVVYRKSK